MQSIENPRQKASALRLVAALELELVYTTASDRADIAFSDVPSSHAKYISELICLAHFGAILIRIAGKTVKAGTEARRSSIPLGTE